MNHFKKKNWNSGLDEDTLKKVVTTFIDILVKKKIQFIFPNTALSSLVNQRRRSVTSLTYFTFDDSYC